MAEIFPTTDTASAKMEELGLSVFDVEDKMRPMNDVFNDLNDILSTMTEGEQTQVLNTIFNKVDLKSVNALLANSGERFDELYAFNRTLRKGNFKYSRNFQPYHSKSLYSLYRYKQAAFREWKKMYNNGKLNKVQSYFFESQGAEELYDLSLDPYETKNLAGDPTYQSKLKELRALLKKQMVDKHDLGLYPECVWLEQGKTNPTQFGLTNSNSIKRYSDIADLEMETFNKAKNALTKALQSNDPVERYWGATVCASFSKEATVLHEELKKMTNDPKAYVRSRAIVALSLAKKMRPEVAMKATLKKAQNKAESLLILNDMAFLKEAIKGCNFRLTEEDVCHKGGEINWRIKYLQD